MGEREASRLVQVGAVALHGGVQLVEERVVDDAACEEKVSVRSEAIWRMYTHPMTGSCL